MNSKNAFWIGMALLVLQTISAMATVKPLTVYAFVFPVVAAVLTYLGKNRQGPIWSVMAQLGANIAAFYAAHSIPAGLSFEYILFQWLIPFGMQILGIFGQKANNEPSNN
jgi:hypothetical protein